MDLYLKVFAAGQSINEFSSDCPLGKKDVSELYMLYNEPKPVMVRFLTQNL